MGYQSPCIWKVLDDHAKCHLQLNVAIKCIGGLLRLSTDVGSHLAVR